MHEMCDGVNILIAGYKNMTSDVDQFGEEAVKWKINQVVIYLVTHDKIIIFSYTLRTVDPG